MCWHTSNLELKIAPQDITVYKFLNPTLFQTKSPCQNFKYKFNKIYNEYRFSIELSDKDKYFGFHSYSGFVKITFLDDIEICLEAGSINCWKLSQFNRIYKCIVPKGTRYFENGYGEIISEQIKITRSYIKLTSKTKLTSYLKDLK